MTSVENIVALVLAVGLAGYLLHSLIFPERY